MPEKEGLQFSPLSPKAPNVQCLMLTPQGTGTDFGSLAAPPVMCPQGVYCDSLSMWMEHSYTGYMLSHIPHVFTLAPALVPSGLKPQQTEKKEGRTERN